MINKNSHYGAKKYGPQLAQPPRKITVTAVLFHCIHVTEIQRAGLHSYIRIYTQFLHATAELIKAYADNKAQSGETWFIEAMVEAVAPPVVVSLRVLAYLLQEPEIVDKHRCSR